MDARLIAWARAVKRRTRSRLPVLWLFTDAGRGADPLVAAARLPRRLCGVVFRHDAAPCRAALARSLARICRARGLALVIAGDIRLAQAVRAGVHLRAGRWPGPQGAALRRRRLTSSSAHSLADLRRARRAGALVAFLSPVFPTASHPGAPVLGAAGWSARVRRLPSGLGGMAVLALGGVSGRTAAALPRACRGAGAIGALGG